jgi:putative transposase
MARLPRLEWPGQTHCLQLRAHGALAGPGVVITDTDRNAFVHAVHAAAAAVSVRVHAYAALPERVLLLATPSESGALGRMVQAISRRYVVDYNRRHAHRGTVWDGRFRSAVIEPGTWRLAALCWVDGQSAEPGMTSASGRVGAAGEGFVVDPPEFWQLGNTPFDREAAYRQRLAQGLTATQLETLREAVQGGWVVGSPSFTDEAERATGRPARPRPRGRPRVAR